MSDSSGPQLSIVVPVHNGAGTLRRCLTALSAQVREGDDVIVVDDGSTEDVGSVGREFRATVIRLDRQSGPAAARNCGAAAAMQPVLFFLDSDVLLHEGGLDRARRAMTDPTVGAVMGSYDDAPDAAGLVSRFKNLAHHYFHQRAAGDIASFWAACGCVRRDIFSELGGFDERRFRRPSIEDVELGWRMADRGVRIVLDPDLQVTHLKRWTLTSLITTDVMYRAAPWVRWSLERRRMSGQLNTSAAQRIASLVAVLWFVSALLAVPFGGARVPFVVLSAAAVAINWQLFQLFWRRGGLSLFLGGVFLQQVYYFCALTGLVIGVTMYCWTGRRSVAAPPARVGC